MYRYVLAVVIVTLAAGCTGSDRQPIIEPMPMNDEGARARYHDILERGSTVLFSGVVAYYWDTDDLFLLREHASCEGEACFQNFSLEGVNLQILGVERGVTRVIESSQDANQRLWVYGGWMEDSFFATQGNQYVDPDRRRYDGLTVVRSYAVGYAPGTNPDLGALNGRWNGLMLGVDVGTWPNRGDALSGDAMVTVELAGDGMAADVSFTNIVDQLDLSEITARYEQERRGGPPYNPRMMVKVLLYGYCIGVASSRRIATRLHEDIAFRVLAANNAPDFRTISDFRKDHLAALSGLFLQVLMLCSQAGLVKLGHVALDGTKVRANASALNIQTQSEPSSELRKFSKIALI